MKAVDKLESQSRKLDKVKAQKTKSVDKLLHDQKQLEQEKDEIAKQLNEFQQEMIDIEEQLEKAGPTGPPISQFFERSRQSRKGGVLQYEPAMPKLICECLAAGAPPSAIRPMLLTFAQTFHPTVEVKSLPSLSYIHKGRTILKIIAESCSVLQLAKANKWKQLCTDATSVGNIKFQDIIISIAEDDVFKPVVLTAATILEDGETAEATCTSIVSAIENSGKHLSGIKEVMKHYFPEEYRNYHIPEDSEMTMAKLVEAFLTSDNCDVARKTTRCLHAEVIKSAEKLRQEEDADRTAQGLSTPLPPIEVYAQMIPTPGLRT